VTEMEYTLMWPSPLPCGCDAFTTTLIVDCIESGEPRDVDVEIEAPEPVASALRSALEHGETPCECEKCGAVFEEAELVVWFGDAYGEEHAAEMPF
jgi:hypothetical protein